MSTKKAKTKRTGRKAAVDFTGDECHYDHRRRVWVANETQRLLRDEDDERLWNEDAEKSELRAALRRDRDSTGPNPRRCLKDLSKGFPPQTVESICDAYLPYRQLTAEAGQAKYEAETLIDFCTGVPAELHSLFLAGENIGMRLHDGFGKLAVGKFEHYHLVQWVAVHPEWDCAAHCQNWEAARRTRVILRAFEWAHVELLIEKNPLKRFELPGQDHSHEPPV